MNYIILESIKYGSVERIAVVVWTASQPRSKNQSICALPQTLRLGLPSLARCAKRLSGGTGGLEST